MTYIRYKTYNGPIVAAYGDNFGRCKRCGMVKAMFPKHGGMCRACWRAQNRRLVLSRISN